MSSSFANQVMAQIELWRRAEQRGKYPVGVYVLPKHLDEKVARLQLVEARRDADGADRRSRRATSACRRQGPYKPQTYRY